jgi:hypothetical protein
MWVWPYCGAWVIDVVLCGCQARDDEHAYLKRPRATGAWSIDGVALGMRAAEVEQKWGRAAHVTRTPTLTQRAWGAQQVDFDAQDVAVAVRGNSLHAADAIVLTKSDPQLYIEQVLGRASSTRGQFSPGSFVIDLVPQRRGTTYTYERPGATLEIMVDKEGAVRGLYPRAPHLPASR